MDLGTPNSYERRDRCRRGMRLIEQTSTQVLELAHHLDGSEIGLFGTLQLMSRMTGE